jgi:hypothetical protein
MGFEGVLTSSLDTLLQIRNRSLQFIDAKLYVRNANKKLQQCRNCTLLLGNYSERITESLTNNCQKSSRDIPCNSVTKRKHTVEKMHNMRSTYI